jgi:hypothetical protein
MKPKKHPAVSKPRRKRKLRTRPTPRWLEETNDLDQIAKRRCLMVLSVLSGEKPVTEAIAEAELTRGRYYQLETRALQAMLRALTPGSDSNAEEAVGTAAQIRQLEEKVKRLEREKRRVEHLLLLTRKLLKPGPFKMKTGRPPKTRPSSTTIEAKRSMSSRKTNSGPSSTTPSIPTTDGAVVP